MKLICLVLLSSLSFLFSEALLGEIQAVTLRWNAVVCLDVCVPSLQKNLMATGYVTNVNINPQAGTAILQWSPNAPFNFVTLNSASRQTGIRLLETFLKVRGKLSHDNDRIYLTSLGDGTRFQLIGPLNAVPGQYTIRANIASHPLSDSLRQQLLEAEGQDKIAVIEGPLFEPEFYGSNLIVQQVKFPKEEKKPTN